MNTMDINISVSNTANDYFNVSHLFIECGDRGPIALEESSGGEVERGGE